MCTPFAEGAIWCFTHATGSRRQWYTAADGKSAGELLAAGRGTAREVLDRLVSVPVEGFTATYWMGAVGDGRDHVPALFPAELAAKLGGAPVVAAPAEGLFLAWVPGDLQFDKVMAVGVRRATQTFPHPVSSLCWRWDGTRWVTWGEAIEADSAPPGPPSNVVGPAALEGVH